MRLHMVSHCSCDQRFRSCLKMAKTDAADSIGNIFFNILKEPCIVFSMRRVRLLTCQYMITTYPQVCSARSWWGRCYSYERKRVTVWRNPAPC